MDGDLEVDRGEVLDSEELHDARVDGEDGSGTREGVVEIVQVIDLDALAVLEDDNELFFVGDFHSSHGVTEVGTEVFLPIDLDACAPQIINIDGSLLVFEDEGDETLPLPS